LFVAGAGREFAAEGGAGAAGDGCDAGVGGEMAGGAETARVADGQEYRRGGLDADSRHGHQDRGKREVIEEFFDFGGDDDALVFEFLDLGGNAGMTSSTALVPVTATVCSPSAVKMGVDEDPRVFAAVVAGPSAARSTVQRRAARSGRRI
jgi:hypothetical protein